MNPFPPSVANEMAFDAAQRLLESWREPSGGSVHMELRFLETEQEWECRFVTESRIHFVASHPKIANAIFGAIDQVTQ